ncbi:MAG: hypothetical protein OXE40_17685, partial [Gammaproteobacteria bacterium]|nr:hypothetical protein [Gammaproteobacteria bacterium]
REAFLLLNNLLFVVALAVVLLGTLYPLAYEALSGGAKISIGPPWFNTFFVPLMLLVALALGIGPFMSWKRTGFAKLRRRIAWSGGVALAVGVLVPLVVEEALSPGTLLAVVLAAWVLAAHGLDFARRVRLPDAVRGKPDSVAPAAGGKRAGLLVRVGRIPLAYWGMTAAHAGFAMSLLGVALTHELSVEKDIRMVPGEVAVHGGVEFRFGGIVIAQGPNYVSRSGQFEVADGDRQLLLVPEKRQSLAGGSVMTEAAIDAGFFKDIYVSLGEPLEGDAWAVRVYVKPFVRWIWFGALFMAFGGVLAIADKRYRRLRRVHSARVHGSPAVPSRGLAQADAAIADSALGGSPPGSTPG